jgi:UDP:flavonoid glycosyltransferase YjiC (YdhE family)
MENLRLGKTIKSLDLNAENLRKATLQVLNDESYLARMIDLSKISRSYNGNKNAASLIVECLQNSDDKKEQ